MKPVLECDVIDQLDHRRLWRAMGGAFSKQTNADSQYAMNVVTVIAR